MCIMGTLGPQHQLFHSRCARVAWHYYLMYIKPQTELSEPTTLIQYMGAVKTILHIHLHIN